MSMKQTGMITWSDNVFREKDVFFQQVVSAESLLQFINQVKPYSHASILYYAVTQGYGVEDIVSPTTGEFDTVAQHLKIFLEDLTTGEKFYHILPAPVSSILENQRGGKRLIQSYGVMYASYVSALRGTTVEFRHGHVVGYKY